MKKSYLLLIALLMVFSGAMSASTQIDSLSWPREVTINNIKTTLYEPQLESYDNNMLQGRMAVSYMDNQKNMVFGALWFKAMLSTDFNSRTVELTQLEIPKVSFPSLNKNNTTTNTDSYKAELIKKIEQEKIVMSLDRLIANMKEVNQGKVQSDADIKNAPPIIYYKKTPAILISIDGEPSFKEDTQHKMEYVQNTPFFMVREKGKSDIYLKGDNLWFTATDVKGPWANTTKVPKSITKYAEQMKSADSTVSDAPQKAKDSKVVIPEVIVTTQPAELIITDGEPNYAPVKGTQLLYVKNTESDIIMDIASQEVYVLLGGRWFHSKALDNATWTFCKPSDLPVEFTKIASDSEMKDVRVSIPNTPEAEDALLEQTIPQTATVKRSEAKATVTFNGDPKFEPIAGTDISYAINSPQTVLFTHEKYYCVQNGVWFVANTATGPWTVADKRPAGVENIPTSSPVSNVKYVYIYNSTPDVVYVGYLPGYMYSYAYDGVVVYGSGYYYDPWFGPYYYPRPFTWGFGVCYSPWGGWGFSFGFSYGWMGWGFNPFWGGYWGPMGYRCGYRGGYYNGYRHGYNRGYAAGYVNGRRSSHNLYHNHQGIQTHTGNNIHRPSQIRPVNRPNNAVLDHAGNVFQKNNAGEWANKTNLQSKASAVDHQQLNRTMDQRARGNMNYNNFRQSESSRFQGGGGFHGGGGGGGFHGGGRR